MDLIVILSLTVQISIFLTFLSFGLRVSVDDLRSVFRHPRQLGWGLLSIFVVMPVVAKLITAAFDLTPVIEVAILTLSVSPVPPLLPHKALRSASREPFTLGLLVVGAVICVTVLPLMLTIRNAVFDHPVNFSDVSIIRTILISLIIPLGAGILIRHFAAQIAGRYANTIEKVGRIVLVVAFLPILIALAPVMWSLIGNGTLLAIVAYSMIGIAAGHFLGGPDWRHRAALAVASSSRHPAIAITLAVANIGELETKLVAAAVVLYATVSTLISMAYLHWVAKGPARVPGFETPA
jgi:BASS family bile acid:Na+ symporter